MEEQIPEEQFNPEEPREENPPADPNLRVVPDRPDAIQITKAPAGSLKEGMMVTLVWQDRDKKTYIHPALFVVKGVWRNGRVNLKVVKR